MWAADTAGIRLRAENPKRNSMNKENKTELPKRVEYIIERLENGGFEAYAVGGCVRDSLIGKEPEDWDICTSALPEETKKIFSGERIIETGLKHGTVTVLLEHTSYEVTTFRTESGYSDFRRPDKVDFVKTVAEDLKRRDFTVNAMAYNNKKGLIDIYGGREDLKKRLIKCVGNPHERFSEDALRIMRAVRFAGVLGFEIEEKTAAAVRSDRLLLKNIAAERISAEFMKLLMSKNPHMIYDYKEVIDVFIDRAENIKKNEAELIGELPEKKSVRLAFLLNTLYKNDGNASGLIHAALKKLKLDNRLIEKTERIISCMKKHLPESLTDCRFLVSDLGIEAVSDYIQILSAEKSAPDGGLKNVMKWIEQIENCGLCTSIRELKIGGNDLIDAGITDGMKIGKLLRIALGEVIKDNLRNEKKELLEYILKTADRV